jgi:hypothetical protein
MDLNVWQLMSGNVSFVPSNMYFRVVLLIWDLYWVLDSAKNNKQMLKAILLLCLLNYPDMFRHPNAIFRGLHFPCKLLQFFVCVSGGCGVLFARCGHTLGGIPQQMATHWDAFHSKWPHTGTHSTANGHTLGQIPQQIATHWDAFRSEWPHTGTHSAANDHTLGRIPQQMATHWDTFRSKWPLTGIHSAANGHTQRTIAHIHPKRRLKTGLAYKECVTPWRWHLDVETCRGNSMSTIIKFLRAFVCYFSPD